MPAWLVGLVEKLFIDLGPLIWSKISDWISTIKRNKDIDQTAKENLPKDTQVLKEGSKDDIAKAAEDISNGTKL